MFTKSQRFLANLVCDMFNLYVIPQLVAYNFETDMFPQLRVRNIGETRDLQQWAAALANLSARNLITLDLDTEQWVRSKIDAPLKLGEKQTPEANVPPVKEPTDPFGNEDTGGETKGDVQGGEEGNQGSKDNQGGG
jgi:hypothetical protein